MKAHDWFGLAVRLVGLWCLYEAGSYGLGWLDATFGLSEAASHAGKSPAGGHGLRAGGFLLLGWVFLSGAGHLTRWTFAVSDTPPPPADDAKRNVGEASREHV